MPYIQRKAISSAVASTQPRAVSPSDLLMQIAKDYLDDQAVSREQVRILRQQLVKDVRNKTIPVDPEHAFELVTGSDGIQYEIREATQRDLSIIHIQDPVVAYNNGWRRIGVDDDGNWARMMARPADPELRAKNLAEYMQAQKVKSVTFDAPKDGPLLNLGATQSVKSMLANADDLGSGEFVNTNN